MLHALLERTTLRGEAPGVSCFCIRPQEQAQLAAWRERAKRLETRCEVLEHRCELFENEQDQHAQALDEAHAATEREGLAREEAIMVGRKVETEELTLLGLRSEVATLERLAAEAADARGLAAEQIEREAEVLAVRAARDAVAECVAEKSLQDERLTQANSEIAVLTRELSASAARIEDAEASARCLRGELREYQEQDTLGALPDLDKKGKPTSLLRRGKAKLTRSTSSSSSSSSSRRRAEEEELAAGVQNLVEHIRDQAAAMEMMETEVARIKEREEKKSETIARQEVETATLRAALEECNLASAKELNAVSRLLNQVTVDIFEHGLLASFRKLLDSSEPPAPLDPAPVVS